MQKAADLYMYTYIYIFFLNPQPSRLGACVAAIAVDIAIFCQLYGCCLTSVDIDVIACQ